MERGILYIATGERYTREAQQSAESVRNNVEYPISIFTDCASATGDVFTHVFEIESEAEGYHNKIKYMRESPFEKTLFLDTDTHINSDISGIYEILEKYDIGIAHDPSHNTHTIPSVPESFPEYNTGVILYKNNQRVSNLLEAWDDFYMGMGNEYNSKDQPAFRRALYQTDIEFVTITREWNCFYNFPGYIAEPPKILHGRIPSPERAAGILDQPGVYRRTWFRLQSIQSRTYIPGYIRIIHTSLKENGIVKTYKKIKSEIR